MDYKELFQGLDTPAVSDALDKLGLPGQCLGIKPLFDEAVCIGPAHTVKFVPTSSPPGGVGEMQEGVEAGSVMVIDNDGRVDCTVWGDILTQYAVTNKFAGTVIDGVCRDVMKAIGERYPMFSRGRFMRTGKDRVEMAAVGIPVTIGDVRVRPGDAVIADANGVVIVPKERAQEVAAVARQIEDTEALIRKEIQQGATLKQAREKLGYHLLQRKEKA